MCDSTKGVMQDCSIFFLPDIQSINYFKCKCDTKSVFYSLTPTQHFLSSHWKGFVHVQHFFFFLKFARFLFNLPFILIKTKPECLMNFINLIMSHRPMLTMLCEYIDWSSWRNSYLYLTATCKLYSDTFAHFQISYFLCFCVKLNPAASTEQPFVHVTVRRHLNCHIQHLLSFCTVKGSKKAATLVWLTLEGKNKVMGWWGRLGWRCEL